MATFGLVVYNNTSHDVDVQIINTSMGSGQFNTWPVPAHETLRNLQYATADSNSTGAIELQVQFATSKGFQKLATVEFDSTPLTNFHGGTIFYGSVGDISPGPQVPGSSNYLFPLIYLGVEGTDPQLTMATVVMVEATGANPNLP